jgi:hypothetical protein
MDGQLIQLEAWEHWPIRGEPLSENTHSAKNLNFQTDYKSTYRNFLQKPIPLKIVPAGSCLQIIHCNCKIDGKLTGQEKCFRRNLKPICVRKDTN